MSWVNENSHNYRDYMMIDDLLTRRIQIAPMPEPDEYHGRNRTVLEQALDSAFSSAAFNLGLRKYKDPKECPKEHLQNLAIERGVFDWYQDIDESEQREMISTSRDIHSRAGTIIGLTRALKQLGIVFSISNTSEPYELRLATSSNLSPELSVTINDRLERYKSERDQVNFERVVPTESQLFSGVAMYSQIAFYSVSD